MQLSIYQLMLMEIYGCLSKQRNFILRKKSTPITYFGKQDGIDGVVENSTKI